MTNEDLAFADATTLGELIAKKTVSSFELTTLYLQRLAKYGPGLGAVVAPRAKLRRPTRRSHAANARAQSTAFLTASRTCWPPSEHRRRGARRRIAIKCFHTIPRLSRDCRPQVRCCSRNFRWSNSPAASAITTPTLRSPGPVAPRGLCDRLRNKRFDSHAVVNVRRERAAPDIR
jgi:hypothetical protein